ncbi:MAG: hypothetical protein EHM59_10835 [Betaproteobacteria bacterium]|nr:MAG: hypothetical protein EHM59_10835 [Betaproteobacteria bacterium]
MIAPRAAGAAKARLLYYRKVDRAILRQPFVIDYRPGANIGELNAAIAKAAARAAAPVNA